MSTTYALRLSFDIFRQRRDIFRRRTDHNNVFYPDAPPSGLVEPWLNRHHGPFSQMILAVEREIGSLSNSQPNAVTEPVHKPTSPCLPVPIDQLSGSRVPFPFKDLASVRHHLSAGNLLLHHV